MKALIKKLIKESIQVHNLKKKSCSCGCNTCEDKRMIAPILNESIAPREILSEGLKYHIDNNKPLTEHVYRAGSQNYFDLWSEARALYSRGIIDIKNQDDLEILTETQLGEFGMYEGKKVPLDFIMEEVEETLTIGNTIKINPSAFPNFEFPYGTEGKIFDINKADYASDDLVYTVKIKYIDSQGDISNELHVENSSQYLNEADKKKKTPPIGKPKRDSSGGKAYKVYVKDPKTKKIKIVRFGSGGLKAKINNSKARSAFAKRHKCGTGEPKTSARYWSCRLPRFAKLLGLKGSYSGFW